MNDLNHDPNERDDLWDLLEKAKKPAVSPLFSRNVLREIRRTRQDSIGAFAWLRRHWLASAASTVVVVVLSINTSRMIVRHTPAAPAVQEAQASDANKPGDAEVINHLDELFAYEENSVWLEDSSN
jgi:hypothetical protein